MLNDIQETLLNSGFTPYFVVGLVVLLTHFLSRLFFGTSKAKLRRIILDFQVNLVAISLFVGLIFVAGYALQQTVLHSTNSDLPADPPQEIINISSDFTYVNWAQGPEAISRWAQVIQTASNTCNVDPALVAAIMRQESVGNPTICSKVGACGLMQLMPATAAELGVVDRFDAQDNVNGGACYIRKMLDLFKNKEHALAAYNAGPGNVRKYGGIPPFPETKLYVKNVSKYYDLYKTTPTHQVNNRNDKLKWPTVGRITQQPSSTHMALDIAVVLGTPILAPADGTIVKAAWYGDYGKTIIIDHGGGLHTLHAHLSSYSVSVGNTVSAGTIVGRSGSTGRSTGPHLHFEVRQSGVLKNPWDYLGDQESQVLTRG